MSLHEKEEVVLGGNEYNNKVFFFSIKNFLLVLKFCIAF